MIQHLFISLSQQRLFFFQAGRCEASFPISTAKNGSGEQEGSYCTPRGWHTITEIIGLDKPINTVFKARQPTGEIYSSELAGVLSDQDWILSRIIRLSGNELGFNQGGSCDTYHRFIYIHGCPDEVSIEAPLSHGCIRMRNQDIIYLATRLKVDDSVFIS